MMTSAPPSSFLSLSLFMSFIPSLPIQRNLNHNTNNTTLPILLSPSLSSDSSQSETEDPALLLAAGAQSRLRRRPAVAVHHTMLPADNADTGVAISCGRMRGPEEGQWWDQGRAGVGIAGMLPDEASSSSAPRSEREREREMEARRSTGCAARVHARAHAHVLPGGRRCWVGYPNSESLEVVWHTVIPLERMYFRDAEERAMLGLDEGQGNCACVVEAVGCAVCGNPLGALHKPCRVHQSRKGPAHYLFLPSAVSPSIDDAPIASTSSTTHPRPNHRANQLYPFPQPLPHAHPNLYTRAPARPRPHPPRTLTRTPQFIPSVSQFLPPSAAVTSSSNLDANSGSRADRHVSSREFSGSTRNQNQENRANANASRSTGDASTNSHGGGERERDRYRRHRAVGTGTRSSAPLAIDATAIGDFVNRSRDVAMRMSTNTNAGDVNANDTTNTTANANNNDNNVPTTAEAGSNTLYESLIREVSSWTLPTFYEGVESQMEGAEGESTLEGDSQREEELSTTRPDGLPRSVLDGAEAEEAFRAFMERTMEERERVGSTDVNIRMDDPSNIVASAGAVPAVSSSATAIPIPMPIPVQAHEEDGDADPLPADGGTTQDPIPETPSAARRGRGSGRR
ncbi:hypothetical protein R3P38DRAFT_1604832 [Favolaschia claudopus]|uniref:Uncharacterized protein n=1 Tax=Favolaschia claudopus TaxID=2862362 RepID=A0AAW0AHY9_9AGAR